MIKNFFVVIALLVLTFNYAQEGTSSPYSFYGIGELKFKGTVENQSMGGLSFYSDSIHTNLRNPAALADIKRTVFTVGLSHNSTQYKNSSVTETQNSASFDYLSLGFPVSPKLFVNTGLLSYSSVGYNILSETSNNGLLQRDELTGNGGLNKVFLSLGYKLSENLNIGITGNYAFGKLENESERVVENVLLGTREVNNSELSGVDFNFGLSYKMKILEDLTFRTGIAFSPEAAITSKNSRQISTFHDLTPVSETEDVDLEAAGLKETDLILPTNVSFGVGLGKEYKWFVGTEVQSIKTGNFKNSFMYSPNTEYKDAFTISLGGFYIPNYNSFTNYWSTVVYRAGIKFEETGLRIKNEEINNFGISFGLGLPVRNFSNINFDFEYGKRGTLNAGLIEENYFNVKLSLSLIDKWFVQRKYD